MKESYVLRIGNGRVVDVRDHHARSNASEPRGQRGIRSPDDGLTRFHVDANLSDGLTFIALQNRKNHKLAGLGGLFFQNKKCQLRTTQIEKWK